jgi:uncharacterized protein YecE (DUF72 family)
MTFKVNRRITHYKKFQDVEEHVECILFQTPPNFNNTGENRKILLRFLRLLRGDHDNEIERRHLRAVYCYFNNDNSGFAIGNAKTLKKMLSRG